MYHDCGSEEQVKRGQSDHSPGGRRRARALEPAHRVLRPAPPPILMEERFAETAVDAARAVQAVRERRSAERRYRRMLVRADRLLERLETLNLRGGGPLPAGTKRSIDRWLNSLTPGVRARFPRSRTVQQALDGVFGVEEELLGLLRGMTRWDRDEARAWDSAVENDREPVRRSA